MNELWFGTRQNMQWVPLPDQGLERRGVSYADAGTLANGGGFGSRSYGRHLEFTMQFSMREAHGANGLDVFSEYASGAWNDFATVVDGDNPNDLIYFCDPMAARQNLFSAHFSNPSLMLQGWPAIGARASDAATAANSYRQPQRTVTFSVTHTASTLPPENARRMVIPIPPGYTLRWGWSGTSTGTGAVRAEAHHKTGGATLVQNAAGLSATAATRLNQSINGDTYDYVTIGIGRTSSATSTVAITSMLAVLHPNSDSPALTGSHVQGMGATGCIFLDDAIPESYVVLRERSAEHIKSLAFSLKEVGAWR